MGHTIVLHVVDDGFPITQEGILGSEFLCDADSINFGARKIYWQGIAIPFVQRERALIPARSQKILQFQIHSLSLAEGYVPQLQLGEGLYLGEALMTNRNGTASGVINTGDEDSTLILPAVELQEVEKTARHIPSLNEDAPLAAGDPATLGSAPEPLYIVSEDFTLFFFLPRTPSVFVDPNSSTHALCIRES